MDTQTESPLPYILFQARFLQAQDVSVFLELMFQDLGISARGYGRYYLREAVLSYCNDPKQLLVDGIYQQVAKRAGSACSKYQVEVTVRRTIQNAWKRRNREYWMQYFPKCEHLWKKPPTNAQFIAAAAALVVLWENTGAFAPKEM